MLHDKTEHKISIRISEQIYKDLIQYSKDYNFSFSKALILFLVKGMYGQDANANRH
jgi:hypothetical protein